VKVVIKMFYLSFLKNNIFSIVFIFTYLASQPVFAKTLDADKALSVSENKWTNADVSNNSASCSVTKKYGRGLGLYFLRRDKDFFIAFKLSHRNFKYGEHYSVQLRSAKDELYASKNSTLQGNYIEIPIGSYDVFERQLQTIDVLKLIINKSVYVFEIYDLNNALDLLNNCMKTKIISASKEQEITQEDITWNQNVSEELIQREPLIDAPSPASVNVVEKEGAPSVSVKNVPLQPSLSTRKTQIINDTQEANSQGNIQDDNSAVMAVEKEKAQVFQHEQSGVLEPLDIIQDKRKNSKNTQDIPSLGKVSNIDNEAKIPENYTNQKRDDTLTEDEYELFESMKTKMFLLEREKEAVRQKLTDLRQKEIETMKADIGSLQKIEEQAEKIRILQQKLELYKEKIIQKTPNINDESVDRFAN